MENWYGFMSVHHITPSQPLFPSVPFFLNVSFYQIDISFPSKPPVSLVMAILLPSMWVNTSLEAFSFPSRSFDLNLSFLIYKLQVLNANLTLTWINVKTTDVKAFCKL